MAGIRARVRRRVEIRSALFGGDEQRRTRIFCFRVPCFFLFSFADWA